ncbi:MAG: RIP metalloprotease RseP [Nitrospirae bacterium]|jgi:regulator of sigma E protease|nr:RIP metalloprotease RseP [Nitrospirota bacterium]
MEAVLSFILVIGVLIVVHETGHFLVARRFGVKIEKFSIGFGPKIFSRTVGETEYRLAWIPLGGYVKMLGENDPEQVRPEERDRSFSALPVSRRMAIAAAGPIANFLLAFFLFTAVFWVGIPVLEPVVGKVLPKSPAQMAGLAPGDKILSVNGKPLATWNDLRRGIEGQSGKTLHVIVQRGEVALPLAIVPRTEIGSDIYGEKVPQGKIGVAPRGDIRQVRYGLFDGLGKGFMKTVNVTRITVVSLYKILTGAISSKNLGGPILIAQMSAKAAKSGVVNLLIFMGFISVTLGVMNLLPVPVLDGGHMLFLTAEGILHRPLSVRVRELSMQVGFVILLTIMVFAFYNDLMRLFGTR